MSVAKGVVMDFAMRPPWWGGRGMWALASHRRGWGWGPPGGKFSFGPGAFFSGRGKMERGGVRAAILHLLSEGPMHGYQIIQELSERTHGLWQPSPGAIYPTLQQLEDEGLVASEERDGKKTYTLTDDGRAQAGSEEEAPWARFCPPDDELLSLRDLAFQVGAAVFQVAHAGDATQVQEVKEVLEETRRRIYQVLAETPKQ